MFDIRDHGGNYGGGKKIFSPEEFGLTQLPGINLLSTYSSGFSIGNAIISDTGELYFTTFSASNQQLYIYKYVIDVITKKYVFNNSRWFTQTTYTPIKLLNGYLIGQFGTTTRALSLDTLATSFDFPYKAHLYEFYNNRFYFMVNNGGQWTYYVYSNSFSLITSFSPTTTSSGPNYATIIQNKAFWIEQSGYKLATINMDGGSSVISTDFSYALYLETSMQNSVISNGILYILSGGMIYSYNPNTMNKISSVNIGTASHNLYDYDNVYLLAILDGLRAVKIRKSDLAIVNFPYSTEMKGNGRPNTFYNPNRNGILTFTSSAGSMEIYEYKLALKVGG